ncbi:MAG: hypothetical protein A2Z16_09455 [Chloroflexi bacterium RBG_16_54_18]|nr:MAG: hypothetical protein A2Z16_09455 [Chloroflexi bacterium RBG_16_54_18]
MHNATSLRINPIIIKELRSRMRGGRAFITLTIILVFLSIFSYAVAQLTMAATQYSGIPVSPQIGQTVFAGLVFLILFIICAITPAVTANAISEEKEKLTFDMLLATPLHPVSVLWGKLVASMSYIFLLIFAALPMTSLVFTYGGVTMRDMLKAVGMLLVIAVMIGMIGLFMSALLRKSGRAVASTYVVVLLLIIGPLFLAAGIGILRQVEPPRMLLIPSPVSALASAMSPSVNPQNLAILSWMFGGTFWIMASPPISYDSIPRPLYHYSLPLYLGLSLVLYLLASRLVLPTRRWNIRWSEWVLALVVILGFIGIITSAYVLTSPRYENIIIVSPTVTPTPAPQIAPVVPELSYPPGDNKIPPSDTPTPTSWNDLDDHVSTNLNESLKRSLWKS